jgi:hypothetical protein
MSATADAYRAKAAECRHLADETRGTFLYDHWLELADRYERMAQQHDMPGMDAPPRGRRRTDRSH